MSISTSTEDKIRARLGGDTTSWTCFGVYDYARPCRTCVCGHSIQRAFVLVRKGDLGPAWGDHHELGSECIKFVGSVDKGLFGELMEKKAAWEKVQRQIKRERIEALRSDPELQHILTSIHEFVAIAGFCVGGVWGGGHCDVQRSELAKLCRAYDVIIGLEVYGLLYSFGEVAKSLRKRSEGYALIEDARIDAGWAYKSLISMRPALLALRPIVDKAKADRSFRFMGLSGLDAFYSDTTLNALLPYAPSW